MSKLFALTFLALVVFAACAELKYKYDFQVGFSNIRFNEKLGNVTVAFKTTVDSMNWKYTFKANIKPNTNTTISTATNYMPHQFKNVTFEWKTLNYPRQQTAYLSHVKLIPTYLNNPYQVRQQTKTFCTAPKHGFVRSDGHIVKLVPCVM